MIPLVKLGVSLCFRCIGKYYHTPEQKKIKNVPREKLNHSINIPWGSFFSINPAFIQDLAFNRKITEVWTYNLWRTFHFYRSNNDTLRVTREALDRKSSPNFHPSPLTRKPRQTSCRSSAKSWQCMCVVLAGLFQLDEIARSRFK